MYRAVPQNGVLALNSSFSPRVFNELKFGYNGALTRVQGSAPTVNGIDLSKISLNISGSIANTGIAGQGASSGIAVPGGLIRGSSAFNGSGFPYTPYSLSFIDNLSWVKGNHTFKFGVEVRTLRLYTDRLGGTTYSFSNLNDFLANKALQIQYVGDLSDPSPFNNGATGNRLCQDRVLSSGMRRMNGRLARTSRSITAFDTSTIPRCGKIGTSHVRFDINQGHSAAS